MAREWTCRRCRFRNLRTFTKCRTPGCTGTKPKPKPPAHRAVLREMPYEAWVLRFGESCGICGRAPSSSRRLDRDHDHATGLPRGLLCHRCNRALPSWADAKWLRDAAAYLGPETVPTEGYEIVVVSTDTASGSAGVACGESTKGEPE